MVRLDSKAGLTVDVIVKLTENKIIIANAVALLNNSDELLNIIQCEIVKQVPLSGVQQLINAATAVFLNTKYTIKNNTP